MRFFFLMWKHKDLIWGSLHLQQKIIVHHYLLQFIYLHGNFMPPSPPFSSIANCFLVTFYWLWFTRVVCFLIYSCNPSPPHIFFNYKDLNLGQEVIAKDHQFCWSLSQFIFLTIWGRWTTNLWALQIWRDLQVCGQVSLIIKEH